MFQAVILWYYLYTLIPLHGIVEGILSKKYELLNVKNLENYTYLKAYLRLTVCDISNDTHAHTQ